MWQRLYAAAGVAAPRGRDVERPAPRSGRVSVCVGAVCSAAVLTASVPTISGCSRESLRIALETQRRADAVQETIFRNQHDALCVLLYRDAVRRLEGVRATTAAAADTGVGLVRGAEERGRAAMGATSQLTAAQRDALSAAWSDRDLLEFWALQHERVKALRLIGVDAYLLAKQSMVDLLIKSLERTADHAGHGLTAALAERAGARVAEQQAERR